LDKWFCGDRVKIIASLVIHRHQFEEIKPTLMSLIAEKSISKIIIVDNGSHCHWLQSFLHRKVEVIKIAKNKGYGEGHNSVFARYVNEAKYILICNPDITFQTGEIDKLYHFSSYESTGVSIPKVIFPDGSLQYCCKLLPSPYQLCIRRFLPRFAGFVNRDYELHQADYNRPFFAPSVSGCFMLISQQVLKEIEGFDPRFFMYLEDVDLSRRVCETVHTVCYCPDAVVIHESQRRSYASIKFMCYHIVSAIRYFNKWGWFFDKGRRQFNRRCLSKLPRT
jgi:GT2 family glycosyltransferase